MTGERGVMNKRGKFAKDELLEWAGLNTTSSFPGWNTSNRRVRSTCECVSAVVCGVNTISTHARGTSVKHGRIDGIEGGDGPIPVLQGFVSSEGWDRSESGKAYWLGTFVTTF